MCNLEQTLIAARRQKTLLGPEVVFDHGCGGEAHLAEVEQCVREPQPDHVEGVERDNGLEQAVAGPLAGNHEAHSLVLALEQDLVIREGSSDTAGRGVGRKRGSHHSVDVTSDAKRGLDRTIVELGIPATRRLVLEGFVESQHPQGSDFTCRVQYDHERLRQCSDVVDIDQRVAKHPAVAHPRVDLDELGIEFALREGFDALDLIIIENECIGRHFLRVGECQLERFTLGVENLPMSDPTDAGSQ